MAEIMLEDLPDIVPIFPLGGVLLLPGAPLPLHIFEPRYRAMTRDAIAAGGYIAMIQPNGEMGDDPMNPPVYGTACLGKIVCQIIISLSILDNNSFFMLLMALFKGDFNFFI